MFLKVSFFKFLMNKMNETKLMFHELLVVKERINQSTQLLIKH